MYIILHVFHLDISGNEHNLQQSRKI
jgi:hypothetical protein